MHMHNTGIMDTGPGGRLSKPARPTRQTAFGNRRHSLQDSLRHPSARNNVPNESDQQRPRPAQQSSGSLRTQQTNVLQDRSGDDSTPRRRKYRSHCPQLQNS